MKHYLVVGGSGGIGTAIVNQLEKEGHKVTSTFNTNSVENRANVEFHQLDVTQNPNLDFLPEVLDGVVYCPGTINLKPFHRIKSEDFAQDYQLQVLGAIDVLQKALPALKKSEGASVVFFSTIAVQTGFPFHTQVAASKGAIEGLTKALAAEWAPKIRVNAIAPSITETPLAAKLLSSPEKIEANAKRHPMNAIGQPKDFAEATSYLLSDRAGWMTGQILHIDGGLSSIRN